MHLLCWLGVWIMVEPSPRKWLAAWWAGVAWWASAWRISIIIIVIIITIMIIMIIMIIVTIIITWSKSMESNIGEQWRSSARPPVKNQILKYHILTEQIFGYSTPMKLNN